MPVFAQPQPKTAVTAGRRPVTRGPAGTRRAGRLTEGRQQVQAVLGSLGVQAALKISRPEDEAEREADRVAEQVLNGPEGVATGRPTIRSVPASANADGATPSTGIGRQVAALEGRGRPLPAALAVRMGRRFGVDFRHVRIHTDGEAAGLAERLQARAFTWQRHIVFARGAWQPDSPGGQRLLAHELTHVIQQRGGSAGERIQRWYVPFLSEAVDAIGELVDRAGNFIAEQGWKLLRRYAPALVPILKKGPINWLREKLAGAFDGIVGTLRRLNPLSILRSLYQIFDGLFTRAGRIVRALLSGDCEPLFRALGELRAFVTEVAGEAWDKLRQGLAPIGEFFQRIYNGYLVPAGQWLKDTAGDLWQSIKDWGRRLWDWLKPLRERIAAAWNWIRDKLFGSDEKQGESRSEGGLVNWVLRKAGEAWDWIKRQTRPIWQPVAGLIEKVGKLLPPAFVRQMGEAFQSLSQRLQETSSRLDGGRGVAANRQALAGALPTLEDILLALRAVLVRSRGWLQEKVSSVSGGLRTILSRLRRSTLLSALAGLLDWFDAAAETLGNWASTAVGGLFDTLVRGFDHLVPFVRRIRRTVERLIEVAKDLFRLPVLVAKRLWRMIPACIREPIERFVREQILARIPLFGFLQRVPELWERVKAFALRLLRQVFVDGDLRGAAWTFFSTMLRLIGLPPELVVSVVAKALGVFGTILRHPLAFLRNVFGAVSAGFRGFFERFGTHMLAGMRDWLFRQVSDAGIEPPAAFTPGEIFAFVLRVLGITVERILKRLERRIGPRRMARLRGMVDRAIGVWAWVRTIFTEGPAALWETLKRRLTGLWDGIVSGIIAWIRNRVILRISARFAASLASGGVMAVVYAIVAIYDAVRTIVEYAREILQMVDRVLDGVADIVAGKLTRAAGYLEGALAAALPVAVAFLARLAGLGGLGRKLREMMRNVQRRIDAAIDGLIDRSVRAGRAFLDLPGRGVRALRSGVARVVQWWRSESRFRTRDGQSHRIFIRRAGGRARLMIASHEQGYSDFLRRLEVPADKREAKRRAQATAARLERAMAEAEAQNTADGDAANGAAIAALMEDLAGQTVPLMQTTAPASSAPDYGSLHEGFGSWAKRDRITNATGAASLPGGSAPSESNEHWEALRRRKRGNYYVRGHLLNEKLGGPGEMRNLTPLTRSANTRHWTRFESELQRAIGIGSPSAITRQRQILNFIVTANYGRRGRDALADSLEAERDERGIIIARIIRAEKFVPRSLSCSARIRPAPQEGGGDRLLQVTIENRDAAGRDIEAARPETYLDATPPQPVYVNEMGEAEFAATFDIDAREARQVLARKAELPGGRFTRWQQVFDAVPAVWRKKGVGNGNDLRQTAHGMSAKWVRLNRLRGG